MLRDAALLCLDADKDEGGGAPFLEGGGGSFLPVVEEEGGVRQQNDDQFSLREGYTSRM